MEICKNCGKEVSYVDNLLWCDDCNYDLELRVMKEREEAED